jgi:transcriptional regulator with XRE-family HTH domain
MSSNKRNTADVESLIGARIKLRRIQAGMSQQIQKYEKGANRVSAGRIVKMAEALECNVMTFFEGLDLIDAPTSTPFTQFLATKDGIAIIEAMLKIRTQELRRTVIDIAEKLAEA